jgi:hypothetical protein
VKSRALIRRLHEAIHLEEIHEKALSGYSSSNIRGRA